MHTMLCPRTTIRLGLMFEKQAKKPTPPHSVTIQVQLNQVKPDLPLPVNQAVLSSEKEAI